MRVCQFLVLLVAFATVTGCARQPARPHAASPVVRSDLDMMTYGAPAAYRQPPMYGPSAGPAATALYHPPRRRCHGRRTLVLIGLNLS
jgi:hypothetical protein